MRDVYDILNPTEMTKDPFFFSSTPFILHYVLQSNILFFALKLFFLLFTLPENSCFPLHLTPTHPSGWTLFPVHKGGVMDPFCLGRAVTGFS